MGDFFKTKHFPEIPCSLSGWQWNLYTPVQSQEILISTPGYHPFPRLERDLIPAAANQAPGSFPAARKALLTWRLGFCGKKKGHFTVNLQCSSAVSSYCKDLMRLRLDRVQVLPRREFCELLLMKSISFVPKKLKNPKPW